MTPSVRRHLDVIAPWSGLRGVGPIAAIGIRGEEGDVEPPRRAEVGGRDLVERNQGDHHIAGWRPLRGCRIDRVTVSRNELVSRFGNPTQIRERSAVQERDLSLAEARVPQDFRQWFGRVREVLFHDLDSRIHTPCVGDLEHRLAGFGKPPVDFFKLRTDPDRGVLTHQDVEPDGRKRRGRQQRHDTDQEIGQKQANPDPICHPPPRPPTQEQRGRQQPDNGNRDQHVGELSVGCGKPRDRREHYDDDSAGEPPAA